MSSPSNSQSSSSTATSDNMSSSKMTAITKSIAKAKGSESKPNISTKTLHIDPSDYQGWTSRDAFGEIYRNWRETILQTFRDYETRFEYQEDLRHIKVLVRARSPLWLLSYAGFIQYEKRSRKVLIVTASPDESFQLLPLQKYQSSSSPSSPSSLTSRSYQLNGQSKTTLMAAIMVLSLEGQKVCIKTKNGTLSFSRRQKTTYLYCTTLLRTSDTPANNNQPYTQLMGMLTLKFRPGKDMEMAISARSGPGSHSIEENTFKDWLSVALHVKGLSEPKDVVTTPDGDLILDPEFVGKAYRDGILLRSSKAASGVFAYGYNFHAETNGEQEEAKILASIWKTAIQQKGESLLRKYVNLLRDRPLCRDVADVEANVDLETRLAIWKLLLTEAGESKFYDRGDLIWDVCTIANDFHKEPVSIPEALCDLLLSVCSVRTPEDEQRARLKEAPEITYDMLNSVFSKHVHRLLRASLLLCDETMNVDVRPASFVIIALPTWILHEAWRENFRKIVRILLEKRFWIQLKQVHLQSHGIPRSGTSLVLLASSVPSPVLWDNFDQAFEASALDRIQGLDPKTSSRDFNCTHDNGSTCPDIDVFNHRTGIPISHPLPQPLTASLDMNDVHQTTYPGFGFDPESDLTWKANYPAPSIFDGRVDDILTDFGSGKLQPPKNDPDGTPRMMTFSIPDEAFPKHDKRTQKGLQVLGSINKLLTSQAPFDFVIITFPSWILHENVSGQLFAGIYGLLENHFCVHLKVIYPGSHTVYSHPYVVLLASTVSSRIPWTRQLRNLDPLNPEAELRERLAGLGFSNTRVSPNTIVCKVPSSNNNIHNHNQGRLPESVLGPEITEHFNRNITHHDGRMGSVREIARIQGFEDDFIFYGSLQKQYSDVIRAFPPAIGRELADTVMKMIKWFTGHGDPPRGQKRRRISE